MTKTSIRFQLLLAINALLAVFVFAFLALDYAREVNERIGEKRVALEEEAKTLLPAITLLRKDGSAVVQEYIDAVCERMRDTQSPGHHIAVRSQNELLQAEGHRRAADSTSSRREIDGDNLIVGTYRQGDVSVHVSEEASDLRESVFQGEIRRFFGLFLLAVLAALIVNVVLIRIVAKPLDRLVATVRSIARGELDAKAGDFQSVELSYLAAEIDVMSESLAAADQEIAMQMAKARLIQQNLLPKNGAVPGIRLSHVYEPATDVAGDYFDILDLGAKGRLFCIADVTGHGVPAAMSAVILKMLLIQAAKLDANPSKILQFINDAFVEVTLAEDFATMLLIRFDPETMKLEYASAGHESAWLLRANGTIQELTSTGLMLGVDSKIRYESSLLSIESGVRLLAYTDGLPEAFNSQQVCFGREAIPGLFKQFGKRPLKEVAQRILQAVDEHRGDVPFQDDLTVAVLAFDG